MTGVQQDCYLASTQLCLEALTPSSYANLLPRQQLLALTPGQILALKYLGLITNPTGWLIGVPFSPGGGGQGQVLPPLP